jgi:hypothetical protein
VLIDALLNHLDDDVSVSKAQDMRRALRPLVDLAHDTKCTVIAIRHVSKAAGPASMRGLGSVEVRNLCRSELTVGLHPDQEQHPGLVMVALSKANLSPNRDATAAFKLESFACFDDDGRETTVPLVRWSEAPPAIHADELVNEPEAKRRLVVDAAVDFLKHALADGPKSLQELLSLGAVEHVEEYQLHRARKKLTVHCGRVGKTSFWSLSEQALNDYLHFARDQKKQSYVSNASYASDEMTDKTSITYTSSTSDSTAKLSVMASRDENTGSGGPPEDIESDGHGEFLR